MEFEPESEESDGSDREVSRGHCKPMGRLCLSSGMPEGIGSAQRIMLAVLTKLRQFKSKANISGSWIGEIRMSLHIIVISSKCFVSKHLAQDGLLTPIYLSMVGKTEIGNAYYDMRLGIQLFTKYQNEECAVIYMAETFHIPKLTRR